MSSNIPMKTAEKICEVIKVVGEFDGATFSEVMDTTGMSKSSTHEYLHTLLELDYLIKKRDEYYVSTKFLEIGDRRRQRMDIFQVARPIIDELAVETGERVSLLTEENGKVALIYLSSDNGDLDIDYISGRRLYMPVTAPGKSILAHLPKDYTEKIIDSCPLGDYGEKKEDIYDDLDFVLENGYVENSDGDVEGVRAIASPVLCNDNVHGAITISGPSQRLSDERLLEDLPPTLLEAVNVIEINLSKK